MALAAVEAKHNPRPMLNFADILIQHDHCDQAVPFLARAQRILPNSYFVKAGWGRTLACLGRPEQALQLLQEAAQIRPCSQVYEWIGLVYGGMGKLEDARAAIQKSVELDPGSAEAHSALAFWYETVHDLDSAELEYRRSLALDPEAWTVRASLQRVNNLKISLRSP
jgi:Tfp pilus assembly protein PilF